MEDLVLGVDIGGVIMDKANDSTDTSFFSENFLETTATPSVFEVLCRLVKKRFGDKVHLVSKAGPNMQRKTRLWLDHHRFFERTDIREDHLHFCRHREEKAPICQALGITHFVDDRLQILGLLPFVKHRYLFCPSPREVDRYKEHLKDVYLVEKWPEIEGLILG